jgi:hypothetical protein
MKQRLLVMNGQKLLQSEQDGDWATSKVEKAGLIKPGIYSLYLASKPDKLKSYEGVVIHSDRDVLYQQVGKSVVKHDLKDFDRMPELGSTLKITYDGSRALLLPPSAKLGQRHTR